MILVELFDTLLKSITHWRASVVIIATIFLTGALLLFVPSTAMAIAISVPFVCVGVGLGIIWEVISNPNDGG